MKAQGIHHVTAISGDIAGNAAFYVGLLCLRLVKRTVIQEEPSTYHLFYGDGSGTAGTAITFFDWPHVGKHRAGATTVSRVFYTVAGDHSLAWWGERLEQAGVATVAQRDFAGRNCLHFSDPEGLQLGIVAAGSFPGYQHWAANAAAPEYALQALHSVTLGVRQLEPTVHYLSEMFGYTPWLEFRSDQAHEREAVALTVGDLSALNSNDPNRVGKELIVVQRTEAQPGLRGTGSVHHVALTVAHQDSIEAWHEKLVAAGPSTNTKVSDIVRRHYFDSIYVRIPGGILFEVATATGAGLDADEPYATLGQSLTLPPFLEGQRADIAAKLKPFTVPEPFKF